MNRRTRKSKIKRNIRRSRMIQRRANSMMSRNRDEQKEQEDQEEQEEQEEQGD